MLAEWGAQRPILPVQTTICPGQDGDWWDGADRKGLPSEGRRLHFGCVPRRGGTDCKLPSEGRTAVPGRDQVATA